MSVVKPSVAVAFLSVVLGAFGLLSGVWTLVYLWRAAYLSAIVALLAAIFSFGMIGMLVTVASGRVVPRVEWDGEGMTVRPDRRVDMLLLASSFAGFAAMALYAILEPLGRLAIRPPSGNGQYLVIACAAGALMGIFALRHMLVQRGTSLLRMTVEGIATANTITTVRRSWDDIAEIADRPADGRHETGATYIITGDGRIRTHPTDWYTPGGKALRDIIRFYWEHPEHRDELTDGTAAQRLQAIR